MIKRLHSSLEATKSKKTSRKKMLKMLAKKTRKRRKTTVLAMTTTPATISMSKLISSSNLIDFSKSERILLRIGN